MLRVGGILAGLVMAAALGGCAAAEKPEPTLTFAVGPDGKTIVVMPENGSADDTAMAMLMQAALDGTLADEEQEQTGKALSEAEIWSQDPDGNLAHIQSGATCPAVWATMQRMQASVFREDGMDVGYNYNRSDTGTVMTFYVFTMPGSGSLGELMDETMESLKTRQPVAKETPYLVPSQTRQYDARTLAYANADGSKMRTSLLMTKVGDWFLKIRLTCREENARVAEETAGLALMGQADRLRNPSVQKTARPEPI